MEETDGSKGHRPWYRSLVPRSGEARSLVISLMLLIIVIVMLVFEYVPRVTRFETGKPSMETVISSRDFSVLDEEATQKAMDEERRRKERLFIDDSALAGAVSAMGELFDAAAALSKGEDGAAERMEELLELAGAGISERTLKTLVASAGEESPLLYTAAAELLSAVMSEPVAYDNLVSKREELQERVDAMPLGEDDKRAARELASACLAINTPYSAAVIAREIEVSLEAVEPVMVNYTIGQRIVEKGEIITGLTLASLSEAGALSPVGNYQQVLGISLLVLIVYGMALVFFRRFRPEIAGDWRVVAMICLVFLVFSISCRVCAVFMDESPLWGYLVPLALVGLILAVLVDRMVALFLVVLGGVLAGVFLKGNIYLTIAAILGGLAGALLVREVRQREDLLRAMLEISLAIAVIAMVTASMIKDLRFILFAGLLGMANGVVAVIATMGSLPLLERISGITTPMRLLELASPDQPLMKELISRAPGTYSHSVIVGNLANAAAVAIGADALLARVGSYYHDIGKMKRSSFFVENQPHGLNGHEGLTPNLSALVITAHVKEGVELARANRLPREIVEIIKQHHGTSLVRYFYARALEEGSANAVVPEGRYRYPGQKPQSKEAAVVMLADAIEAAAKTIEKPNPVRLEQLSVLLARERLEDGQLSESNLTMGDLEKINKAFVRILSGMYHARVEYPRLVREAGAS